MNHLVSDFIIRIKNAGLAKRKEVDLPYSNINRDIGKVLVKEGFLEEIKEEKDKNKKSLKATIRYERRSPVFSKVLVVSKPSLRIYKTAKTLADMERRGGHTILVSTSQGIMTSNQARKKGVGGEVLFEIW